jgi:hypothetical protein
MKQIEGKKMAAWLSPRFHPSLSGYRVVRVISVVRRRSGEVVAIRGRAFSASSGRFDGRVVKVWPSEWRHECCGVEWFGGLRPVDEFLNTGESSNE